MGRHGGLPLLEGDCMNRGTDRDYLLNEQYKDASNLSDRGDLHARFSTHPVEWMRWLFDQLDFPGDATLLELGCGPAWLWQKNLDRILRGGTSCCRICRRGCLSRHRTICAMGADVSV